MAENTAKTFDGFLKRVNLMSSNEKTSDDSLCGNIEQIEIFHSENTYRARSWSKEHALSLIHI